MLQAKNAIVAKRMLKNLEAMMITLENPLDMHAHLREGEILKAVVGESARQFSGILAMPNLKTPC